MTSPVKLLIVDDEKPTRDAMVRALSRAYTCLSAPDGDAAMKLVAENPDLALILTDYKMPGMNGIELIKSAKTALPSLGAILITAFGEIELAVEAMKSGADDFLTKPITDLDQLELRAAKAIGKYTHLETPALKLSNPKTLNPSSPLASFTGSSPAMERVYSLIRRVAPTAANVLVTGPSGTGKELVARAIHDLSPRAKKPFVAVECAALSSSLLESELFGYMPGAFTGALAKGNSGRFEAANGGTIFLDEIGEIDTATQIKLLRVLETRKIQRVGGNEDIPVDFRLVCATNKNLAEMVVKGTFREDLFYRINVIDINTPALKDHAEDIPALAERFLGEFASINNPALKTIEPDAMSALKAYEWPGNVRQLRNIIEKMTILATGDTISSSDIPAEITAPKFKPETYDINPPTTNSLADAEREQILSAIEKAGGNKSKAADALGISRRTIQRKLKDWGLA